MEGDTLDDQETCCDTLDDRDTNCDTLGDQDANCDTLGNRDIVDNYDIPGDQNTNCNIQGNSTASTCEKDIAGILIPAATTVLQERTNVSNRSVDVRVSTLPTTISSQSTGCNSTAIDSVVLPNLCLGILSTSTPVAHVSSPVVVTSSHVSPSAVNMSSLLAHVSSSLVTMSSTTANKNYLPSPPVDHVSYALSLLAADPYLINTSLPSLLCNGFVTNEVSSPVLPSSSVLTSTSLVSDNRHGSISSVKVSSCNSGELKL